MTVLANSTGFDGQFYYRFALNPITSERIEYGIEIDSPPLRHQRILYPSLAWLLSAGSPGLVPWAMIFINFIGLCVMGWIGGMYAQTLRQHALWGVILPLYPGFLLTLSRNLVEILEISLWLGSLLLVRGNKTLAATVLLVLAILTKETSLLVAIAAGLVYLWERLKGHTTEKRENIKWYYCFVPILIFALWQATLYFNWGEFPIRASGAANLGVPLLAPATFFLDILSPINFTQQRAIVEMAFLAAFVCSVISHFRSSLASNLEKVSWLLFALLAASLTRTVWTEDWTFLRASSHAYTLGAIILVGSESKVKTAIFGFSLMVWLLLFWFLCTRFS